MPSPHVTSKREMPYLSVLLCVATSRVRKPWAHHAIAASPASIAASLAAFSEKHTENAPGRHPSPTKRLKEKNSKMLVMPPVQKQRRQQCYLRQPVASPNQHPTLPTGRQAMQAFPLRRPHRTRSMHGRRREPDSHT